MLKLLEDLKEKLNGSPYSISEEGDLLVVRNDKEVKVCNFILIPTHIVSNESRDASGEYKYIFEGILRGRDRLKKIEVSSKEIASKVWIKKWNPFCKIYPKIHENFDTILDFIYIMSKQAKKTIEFDSIGWNRYENQWIYLQSEDKDSNSLQIKTTFKDFQLLSNQNIDEEKAFQKTLEMLGLCDQKLTYSLFSFLLTSLLTTPLTQAKDLSPNFSLWIYGKSGMGKTSLAELYSKIFNKENMIRVDSYRNRLKEASKHYKDCVLILDDFGTSKNKSDENNTLAKIENLIRALSDKSNSLDSDVVPRGLLLFTGERFIEMNESNSSTVARLIRVKMDNIFNRTEKGYSKERVEKFIEYKEGLYLSTSIKYYLNWLVTKINNNLLEEYNFDFKKLRKEIDVAIHARCVDSIAHMIIAFNFFITYGKERGFITPEQYMDHCNKARSTLLMVLEDQRKSVPDPMIERFFDVFKELLLSGRVKVIEVGNLRYPAKLNNDKNIYGILDLEKNSLKLQWNSILKFTDDFLREKENFIPQLSQRSKSLGKLLSLHGYVRFRSYENTNNVTTPSKAIFNGNEINCRVIDFYADKIPEIREIIKELNPRLDLEHFISSNEVDVIDEGKWRRKKKTNVTFLEDGEEVDFEF